MGSTTIRWASAALMILALGFGACEPLRPLAPPADDETRAGALRKARHLLDSGRALPEAVELLGRVLDESEDEEEREQALRSRARAQVQWFQLAHISHDLLTRLPGYNRLYNTLMDHLNGEALKVPADLGRVPPGLEFLTPLVGAGRAGANPTSVKRELVSHLTRLESSPEVETRRFATSARLLLNVDSGWRYSRNWRAPASRVKDLLAFLERRDAAGLRDNAWLILRLSFSLAFDEPSLPSRQLAEAAAALTGRELPETARTGRELLAVWRAQGETTPEVLWTGWRTLRREVDEALEELGRGLTGDGMVNWRRLEAYLELKKPEFRADPAALYAIGQPARAEAVVDWLGKQQLAPLTTPQAIDAFEKRVRNQWRAKDADGETRADAMLVMGCLGVVHAAAHRLGDRVRGRALRLLDRGEFNRRSLILPGGAVYRAFPNAVQTCLSGQRAGCLRGIVDDLVRKGSGRIKPPSRPRRPGRRPAP